MQLAWTTYASPDPILERASEPTPNRIAGQAEQDKISIEASCAQSIEQRVGQSVTIPVQAIAAWHEPSAWTTALSTRETVAGLPCPRRGRLRQRSQPGWAETPPGGSVAPSHGAIERDPTEGRGPPIMFSSSPQEADISGTSPKLLQCAIKCLERLQQAKLLSLATKKLQ